MLTYQQLKNIAQFDEITKAIDERKQSLQQDIALPIDEQILNSPLTPLPIKLLYFGAQSLEQQREVFRVMINFLDTTFEQRVNGNGVVLLKESEVGITSTLFESGNNSVKFPFSRNIAHYAFYYKWQPVVDYFIKQDLKEFILQPDNQGLTPLELYFINYRQIQDHITKHLKTDIVINPKFKGAQIDNEKYLFKLAMLNGLMPNLERIVDLQPNYVMRDNRIVNVRQYLRLLFDSCSGRDSNNDNNILEIKTWLSDF